MVTRVKPRRRLWPPSFGQVWAKTLWQAMVKTGKGYRRQAHSVKNYKEGRRPDKVKAASMGVPQFLRRYKLRYEGVNK
jgi:hypothetical protein